MVLGSTSDSALAIDLGTDAVRLIGTARRKGKMVLEFCADQSIAEGPTATLPERHLEALGQLLSLHRVRTRKALAALPTSMVLTRTIKLDKAQGQSPEEQILWTLENCLPFDPRDLIFDFWPIGEVVSGRPTDVMVVATQASVVDRYLKGFEKLKLACVHMDVAPCALATLIKHSVSKPDAPICTISLSTTVGFFAVAEHGRIQFWRPFEIASITKNAGAAQSNLDRMGDEVSKCFSHMATTMQLDRLSEMLIYGQGSDDPALTHYLSTHFQVPVRAPSPFEALPADTCSEEVKNSTTQKLATHYCTAVGLALQTTGDKSNG